MEKNIFSIVVSVVCLLIIGLIFKSTEVVMSVSEDTLFLFSAALVIALALVLRQANPYTAQTAQAIDTPNLRQFSLICTTGQCCYASTAGQHQAPILWNYLTHTDDTFG